MLAREACSLNFRFWHISDVNDVSDLSSAFGTKTDVGGLDRGGLLLTLNGHPGAVQRMPAQSPQRTC